MRVPLLIIPDWDHTSVSIPLKRAFPDGARRLKATPVLPVANPFSKGVVSDFELILSDREMLFHVLERKTIQVNAERVAITQASTMIPVRLPYSMNERTTPPIMESKPRIPGSPNPGVIRSSIASSKIPITTSVIISAMFFIYLS
jgi:hypothetical protein